LFTLAQHCQATAKQLPSELLIANGFLPTDSCAFTFFATNPTSHFLALLDQNQIRQWPAATQ
jgi:hypothetical protein